MRCRCSASQESLETTSSRALRRSAGGTLSSRSRMSASAFAVAAFSIIEGLLPGTNIIDLMGFIWNSVTRAKATMSQEVRAGLLIPARAPPLYEFAERRQIGAARRAWTIMATALNCAGARGRTAAHCMRSRGKESGQRLKIEIRYRWYTRSGYHEDHCKF